MKATKRIIISCLILIMTSMGAAYSQPSDPFDSLEISLLTCEPHQAVYSLYGHTAIRIHDLRDGRDFVVNYGVFNMDAPYFILRFAFGLTDYEMGVMPFDAFCKEYQHYGSGVIQQDLRLTSPEKANIMHALQVNALPENVVYRYNYFYDNCTTRARDIIVDNMLRHVNYPAKSDSVATFRSMVHQYNSAHPWSRFGIDLLLGMKSDVNTTPIQRQFLPNNLRIDFDHATVADSDGSTRPLVVRSFYVVSPGLQVVESEFPLRPSQCAWLLLIITLIVTLAEIFMKKHFWLYDIILMLATGLSGIIIFAMLFSEQPTVSSNLQILLLNPLPLFFIYPLIRRIHNRQPYGWWKIWAAMLFLFFAGSLLQHYAEGMLIVGLALLVRCLIRIAIPSPSRIG